MVTEIQKRNMLETLVTNFTEAFNREEIEEVMSYFSDDAVYEEFNGVKNVGLSSIRKSLEPQFSGKFGKMRFYTEDMFIDTSEGKAMVRWLLTLEEKERAGAYRGLDLLYFINGELVEKLTYCKANVPLILKKSEMLQSGSWPA